MTPQDEPPCASRTARRDRHRATTVRRGARTHRPRDARVRVARPPMGARGYHSGFQPGVPDGLDHQRRATGDPGDLRRERRGDAVGRDRLHRAPRRADTGGRRGRRSLRATADVPGGSGRTRGGVDRGELRPGCAEPHRGARGAGSRGGAADTEQPCVAQRRVSARGARTRGRNLVGGDGDRRRRESDARRMVRRHRLVAHRLRDGRPARARAPRPRRAARARSAGAAPVPAGRLGRSDRSRRSASSRSSPASSPSARASRRWPRSVSAACCWSRSCATSSASRPRCCRRLSSGRAPSSA